MARSGSTGSRRRELLRAAALLPAALLARPRVAAATDYTSAEEAFAALDTLEAEVQERLRRLGAEVAVARAFAASLQRDHEKHLREREDLRRRLGLRPAASKRAPPPADALDLVALKDVQEKLTYAHAEALPVLGQAPAVQTLARHMVDASRHLTLLGLWMEEEERRG
jgi:hypothetical protein